MDAAHGDPPREGPLQPVERRRLPAKPRTSFDVMFGIALPGVCLLLDPGVLRRGTAMGLVSTPLERHALAAYVAIVPGILLLAAWLWWKRGPLFFAGPLFVGGLVALAVGVVLLPLSIPASILLIGLLGLVPFGTALTFFRNGIRAFRAASAGRSAWAVGAVALTMAAATAAIPVVAEVTLNGRTREALDAALAGDPGREAEAIAGLKPFGWVADRQRFVEASLATTDPAARDRLARVWEAVTGELLRTWSD